jgi:geranylgeranyl diphosphate synthase type II
VNATLALFSGLDSIHEVDLRLERYFDRQEEAARAHGAFYGSLWSAARQACAGGKRFRPALVLGTYRHLGNSDLSDAVEVATAVELLHTAILLHDDVIDRDTIRRGCPNLVGTFSARAAREGAGQGDAELWGQASAILAGDLLLHAAQGMIARLPIDHGRRIALLDLLDRCVFVTAAGELSDVAFSTHVIQPGFIEVLEMAEWKTASYSFVGPLQAGAILAGASPSELHTLESFGRLIGIAFQLRDDLLGVFGDESETGKSVSSDLRSGKLTPMIAYARGTALWSEVGHLFANPRMTEAECSILRDALSRCGARQFIESMIADYNDNALQVLASSELPAALRENLAVFARRAMERVS